MLWNPAVQRARLILALGLPLAALAWGLLFGPGSLIVSRNRSDVATLPLLVDGVAEPGAAGGALAALTSPSQDTLPGITYRRVQLILAAGEPLPDQMFSLDGDYSVEFGRWFVESSALPGYLSAGNPDEAARLYRWTAAHVSGARLPDSTIGVQIASAYIKRAYKRHAEADTAEAEQDWLRARSYFNTSDYSTFADLAEKLSAGARPAQQYLLGLDVAGGYAPAVARIFLARSFNAGGRPGDALSAVYSLLGAAPGDTRAWQQYGQALVGLKRLPEAEDALKKAVSLAPDDVQALNRLGVYYMSTGHDAEAETVLRRALSAAGGSSYWVWEHLGDVLAREGRRSEASDAYRASVAAAPPDLAGPARDKLAELER